jgi:hypothetical protein
MSRDKFAWRTRLLRGPEHGVKLIDCGWCYRRRRQTGNAAAGLGFEILNATRSEEARMFG